MSGLISTMFSGKRVALVLALAAGGGFVQGSLGCASSPDPEQRFAFVDPGTQQILQPNYAFYRDNLDDVINRRCATLDCHGQPGRAFRSYGTSGLRLFDPDAKLTTGGQKTVEKERKLNYLSIVSLDPEQLRRVIANYAQDPLPTTWLFLRKPLLLERHMRLTGDGRALTEGGDLYNCIAGWLALPHDIATDAGPPPGDAGPVVPVEVQKACANANAAN